MRIVALVKYVPDTIEPRLSGERPDLAGIPGIANPFDLYAIEEAVRIKERLGAGVETVAVTAGRPEAESALRDALAMGVDRALCVDAPELEEPGADLVFAAKTLAAAIRRLGGAELVLCGQKSLDQQSGILPGAVAEALGFGFVPDVGDLQLKPPVARVTRLLPSGRAIVEIELPAVLAVLKAINEPRLAPLRGMMRARRAEIPHVPLADLSGPAPRRRAVLSFQAPPARPAAMILEGTPQEQARALVEELRRGRLL